MAERLSLSDRQQLVPLIEASLSPFSEYSFANLYLFRHRHDYRFAPGPMPHLTGVTYDGVRHAIPLGYVDGDGLRALLEQTDCLYPIQAHLLEALCDVRLDGRHNDADSDYIFSGVRLAALDGAKKKRAQARAFEQDERPWSRPLTATDIGQALDVLAGWLGDVGKPPAATDHAECIEALALFDVLDLEGLLVGTGEGGAVAFLLASRGADGSRIVHFAKGRRAFAGAYPWMFARYAAISGAPVLNFEQDLGNPAFAQAKQALGPIAHLRKYRLGRK